MVQILPLALFGAVIAASVMMSLRPAPGAVARTRPTAPLAAPIEIVPVARPVPAPPSPEPMPAPAENYDVTVDQATLRTGPADTFQIIVILPRGTRLRAFEADPSKLWLRVALPDGSAGGFVASTQLSAVAGESAP